MSIIETEESILVFGHVSLISDSGKIRTKFPLVKPTLSFGRLNSCDCRIQTALCSREHATIFVNQDSTPFTANIQVYSNNGVNLNGKSYYKGSEVQLNHGDEFIIAEKKFRWESTLNEDINKVDITPLSQRQSIRYSLISAAKINTPTKSNSIITPFDGFSSSPSAASLNAEQELMKSEAEAEGVEDNGDLITWDEVEEEVVVEEMVEEIIEVEEVNEVDDIEEEDEEESTPIVSASPVRKVLNFVLGATPSLADRPRSIRPPTSVRKISTFTPRTKTIRRTSLRMTIAPQSKTIDWNKEVELQKLARKIVTPISSPSPVINNKSQTILSAPSTPTPSAISTTTPTKLPTSTSSSRIASDHSNTSRRISALLLTPKLDSTEAREIIDEFDSDEDAEGSDESSEDDDELEEEYVEKIQVDDEDAVPLHIAVSEKLRILEIESDNVESVESAEEEEEEEGEVVEQADTLLAASQIALPESPAGSPTATPRLPRHTPSRRHSLREKVLIRSAIRTTITPPPQSPTDELTELELGLVSASKEVTEEGTEEEEAQEELQGNVRPQDIPLPESPIVMDSPRRTPASAHRDSIEIFRSRSTNSGSGVKQLFSHVEIIVPMSSSPTAIEAEDEASSEEEEEEETVEEMSMLASPSPAERTQVIPIPFTTPKTERQARAAAIPLPETPVDEETDSFNPLLTPVKLVLQPPASPFDVRDAFFSEMTSPVNTHRVMATPRSVLRTGPATGGRRKSIRGFLSFTTAPPSTRRKVVFNEQVYIQEIVDIRDKSLHWNPKIDKAPLTPRSVPLPDSPASSEMGSPRSSTRPTTPSSLTRRAQRVPTSTPSSIVRKAISEAQELASPSVQPSPRRVPIQSPAPSASTSTGVASGSGSTPRNLSSPSKSTTTPVLGSVQKASRVLIKTPTLSTKKTPSITSLLESAIPQMNSPSTIVKSPSKSALWAQVAALQKRTPQQRFALGGSTNRTPITTINSILKPKSTLKSAMKATSALSNKLNKTLSTNSTSTTTVTPIQFVQPRPTVTPNLIGFRAMFGPSTTPKLLSNATPNFNGIQSLFNQKKSLMATPGMEGLEEMMRTPIPSAAASERVLEEEEEELVEEGTPTKSAPIVAAVEEIQLPVAVEVAEAIVLEREVIEPTPIVEEELVEAAQEVQEVPEIQEEVVEAVREAVVEVGPEVAADLEAEVVVEVPQVIESIEETSVISEVQVLVEEDIAPIETPEEPEVIAQQEVEVEVAEVVVESEVEVIQEVEEISPVVEEIIQPIVEEEVLSVEESPVVEVAEVIAQPVLAVVEEVTVEAAAAVVEESLAPAPVVAEEEIQPVEEEEVVVVAPVTRRGRAAKSTTTKKANTATKKAKVVKEIEPEVEEEEEEVPVITLPTKTKTSKSKPVEVAFIEIEAAPTKGRGRAKKAIVEVVATPETVEQAPIAEKVPVVKAGRKSTKKVVEPVEEVVAEVEVAPVVVEKKKPVAKGRAKAVPKETMIIHEDTPAETLENQPKVKATRGKKAVVEVNENVQVVKVKKTTTKKAVATKVVVEEAEVAPVRALRARRGQA